MDEQKVFAHLCAEIEQCGAPDSPLVVAMDDSLLRKTGRTIYGSGYRRDPLSPPFRINFVRGLRVLQISAAVRQGSLGAARMIPIDFQHAALPAKPHKKAPQVEQEAYQAERAKKNINLVGRARLAHLRQQMDERGSSSRRLIATLDGRFTNSTVLKHIPQQTVLIGRVRKDAAFFNPPEQQPERGRKRKYGQRCPTPEALLKDEQVPWQTVSAYAVGKTYQFKIKTLAPMTPIYRCRNSCKIISGVGILKSTSGMRKPSWEWVRPRCAPKPPTNMLQLWQWQLIPCCFWLQSKPMEPKASPILLSSLAGINPNPNKEPPPTN